MSAITVSGKVWRICLSVSAVALVAWPVLYFAHADPDLISVCRVLLIGALGPAVIFGIADYGWRRFLHELPESLRISSAQIRANKLRSALTALGVIIGILAVTLMGTAINGIDAGVERSFSGFGDDILYVTKWPWRDTSQDWWNYRNRRPVRHEYARQVNEWIGEHPGSWLKLAVPMANRRTTIIRGEYRLNNIFTRGTSSDYALIMRTEMKEGRFFSDFEAQSGANVAIIGFDVAEALFPGESALGRSFQVRDQNFKVVGVAARQGSFLGIFSLDSTLIMPITTYRRYYRVSDDAELHVQVDVKHLDEARDELRGLMRNLRQLGPEKGDDFEINQQSTFREPLDKLKSGIALAGLFITGLALFVGAIGIMNITYVSVKERTKEIGTRKALGARRRTILLQFLIEAVSICVIGGVTGLLLTVGITTIISSLAPSFPLVVSALLVLVALGVSFLVGVLSGFLPALSASKLDPVVALRYE